MDFRLLGAVEAWSMQQRIDLGPPKQRFLLAVLALQINQLVSVDRLVDLTWPHSPPATAQHAIHVRISQLRATFARQRDDGHAIEILTRGSAYMLRADPMCVDTHRFRAVVAEARAQTDDREKVSLYRRAIGMWQGPPLADVATPEIVDRLCNGLEETRLIALEECLAAELRLGRHRMVVDELAELVAQYPFRQRLLAKLMVALHRAGRAPEALGAYKLARLRMVEELGLEPEAALKQLENAILRADPALDIVEPTPVVPAPRAPETNGHSLAVETIQLSRRFGNLIAVDDVNISVRTGEVTGVLGAPGAGKTTIFRLLSTVLTPTGGSFAIAGIPSSEPVEIRKRIGVLPAAARYPNHMTGQEYLRYHARLFGAGRSDSAALASGLLAEVGLAEAAAARIATYDHGMCRRLGMARALVNEPTVVLLDEPTAGLDHGERHRILDIVRHISTERGATVLFSTRQLAEAEQVCGRVLVMADGAAVAFGPIGETTRGLAVAVTQGAREQP